MKVISENRDIKNVNQDDYLRDESDEETDTHEQNSVLESDSSKTDTINTIVTQISELGENSNTDLEESDNIPVSA